MEGSGVEKELEQESDQGREPRAASQPGMSSVPGRNEFFTPAAESPRQVGMSFPHCRAPKERVELFASGEGGKSHTCRS